MKSIRVSETSQLSSWGHGVTIEPRFETLIARLEQTAHAHPDRYRWSVMLAGMVGYLVIGGLLFLFAGLSILMVLLMFGATAAIWAEIKGLIIFGGITLAIARAIVVTPAPPDGIKLCAAQAPALFGMVERVRAKCGGPAISELRITNALNAAITQEPRALIFGNRNTLYLGLPLLAAMREDEVMAVVAHEFGHFVGKHGRSSGFAYRIRARWAQLGEHLPDGVVAGLLRRFFDWYGPWFASYSFVLARRQEYEADRVASKVVGTATSADALKRIAIQSERFNAAWSDIWHQAPLIEDPPASPFRTVVQALHGDQSLDLARLEWALEQEADHADTHPTLAQRIDALGQSTDLPPSFNVSAAETLLGDAVAPLFEHFNAEWHEAADGIWAEDYTRRQAERAEQHSLTQQIDAGDRSFETMFRHAELGELLDPEDAVASYEAVFREHPESNDARFFLGVALLNAGEDRGIALLVEAGETDPEAMIPAFRQILSYLLRTERIEDAEPYLAAMSRAQEEAMRAEAEVSAIDETARFQPLDDAMRRAFIDTATGIYGLKTLHAALRELKHGGEQIVFVFATNKGAAGQDVLDDLIALLTPHTNGNVMGIERSPSRRWLTSRIKKIRGSRIV